jgi:Zn-dependent protease with chaperone function
VENPVVSTHENAMQSPRARQRLARRGGMRARALALTVAAALPAFSTLSASNARGAESPASTSAPAAVPAAGSAANGSNGANSSANAAASPATNAAANSAANSAANGNAPANVTSVNLPAGVTGTGRVVRFGNAAVYRNLIPSPMLEAQATAEFNEIVRGAAHSNRLYAESDPHVQRVRAFVDRLAPYALKWSDRVKNWKWEVAVIRSNDIRMYALPGGKIVVYGGILDRVKLNDNEFGMLLGHEIAHAVREHVRERLGEQQAAQVESGSVPQLFGLADLGVFPLGIGSQLVEMHYGRADETEADVIGSDIAARAGFDPRAALTAWDKLATATRADRDQGFIYVHPYTPARRADIAKRLADMMPLYAKALGKQLAELPDYEGIPAVQKRKVVSAP